MFVNDTWRISDRLTANLGLRFDKNDGADQSGNVVAKDSAWSPRLGIIWDPTGEGDVERDGQRREVRRGDFESGRRFVGGRRQPADPAVHLSRRQHQRPGHDHAGADGAGDSLGVRLVLRQRRSRLCR